MSDPGPPVPTQFGKYLLDGELAQGGMARVFSARLRGPGGFEKRLVVKQILPKLARDPAFIDLFVREANTLVQMSHPHIVPVYELGVVDGVYFLALEWVEGVTLSQIVRRGRAQLDDGMLAHVGAQVCEALHYAFTRFSVVHRDVTPRNIMVDTGGHARLLDFGIAAPVADTGGGARFGSPGYMAPEQLRGEGLGARTDLFSLGASLYEGLAGRAAFPDRERARHVETLDPPAPLPASVDPELATLVMSMLAFDPAQRPRDAAAAAVALRAIAARHHPQGIAHTLGELVATLREQQRTRSAGSAATAAPTPTEGAGTEAKSIATHAELRRIMEQPTEPISRPPGPASVPGAPVATVPITPAGHTGEPGTERLQRSDPPPTGAPDPEPADDARLDVRRYVWPLLALATAGLLLWVQPPSPPAAVPPADTVDEGAPGRERRARTSAGADDASVRDARAGTADAGPADGGPETAASPPAATPPSRGFLTVGALPWGEVRIDGQAAGTTPLRRRALSPGKHVVVVGCPPLGRQAQASVEITAGERTHLQIDLNRDPPLVTTR